jgi:hypothetical protein
MLQLDYLRDLKFQTKQFLEFFKVTWVLRKKIVAYMKNEDYSFNIMISTLKSLVNCETLGTWRKVFKEHVLVMHLLRIFNM